MIVSIVSLRSADLFFVGVTIDTNGKEMVIS